MFTLVTFGQCLIALFIGLLCWGTWGNIMKSTGLDSTISMVYNLFGQLVFSCIWCLTLGQVRTDSSPQRFSDILADVDGFGIIAAILAGAILASANALVQQAANMGSVAIAFPAVLGLGLVGGSTMNYIIESKGHAQFLFSGVALGVLALLFNARAFMLGSARKMAKVTTARDVELAGSLKEPPASTSFSIHPSTRSSPEEVQQSFLGFLSVCVTAGLLSMAWSPVSVWASNSRGLHVYQLIFFFHFGMVLPLPFLLAQTKQMRLLGGKREVFLCVIAGMMDCLGRILMFVSGSAVSFAMSFGIIMCSPVVASLEGVVLGEMRGASAAEIAHFSAMILSYCLAVALLALSQTSV